MLTDQKIKEVQRLLGKGIPEGEIKNQLQSEGYTEEDIKKIFAPRKYDMRSWLLFFSIIIFVAGVYFFIANTNHPLLLILLAGLLFFEYYRLNKKRKREGIDAKNSSE